MHSWQKETQKKERKSSQEGWQQELRAEPNMAPGLHCSAFPGETDPFLPSVESPLKVSRERKRWEMKGSLCKSSSRKRKGRKTRLEKTGKGCKKVVMRVWGEQPMQK